MFYLHSIFKVATYEILDPIENAANVSLTPIDDNYLITLEEASQSLPLDGRIPFVVSIFSHLICNLSEQFNIQYVP